MRRVLACTAAAWLAGCDTPGTRCEDGVREVGAVCLPEEGVLRVGYGFAPTAMARVDVDGDGTLDTLAASPSRQTLTIAWGPGSATSWPMGEEIAGLAIGDVDGDGRLDVVTALPERDAVAVLRGRGGREFSEPRWYAAGDTPRAVIVAELDGGGAAEIVTANVGDGSVSVLRERVAGEPVIVGPGPHALAAGDLNGDGMLEVVVALSDVDAAQVLVNDGSGGFSIGEALPVGVAPMAVVAADLDGDEAIDVATADALGDTVTVVLGDGAGGARETRTWAVAGQPQGLVVVAEEEETALGVLSLGTGEVTLLNPRTGGRATGVSAGGATAVVSGDGALIYGGTGTTAELRREAQGLRFAEAWRAPGGLLQAIAADVDGDVADEVIAVDALDRSLTVTRGKDGVRIAGPIALGYEEMEPWLGAADVDGDGRVDVVAVGRIASTNLGVRAFLQGADGGFMATGTQFIRGDEIGSAVLGDVDGDGRVDLLVNARAYGEEERRWVLFGEGGGGWVDPLEQATGIGPMVGADLDGNEYLDVVTIERSTWSLVVERDPGGDSTIVGTIELPWRVDDVAVGSLDGDAELDAVVCGPLGLAVVKRLTSAVLAKVEEVHEHWCSVLDVRDVDADGDVDILSSAAEGPTAAVDVWINDGFGVFTPGGRQGLPVWRQAVFAELDGDGRPDVVTADEFVVTAHRGELGPVLVEGPATTVGQETTGKFGDFDGDGRMDRVMVQPDVAVGFAGDGGIIKHWRHTPLTGLVDADVTWVIDHAVIDVEGDGVDEVVTLGWIDSPLPLVSLSLLRFDESGTAQGEPITRLVSEASKVFARDFDGDEIADLLLVNGYARTSSFLKGTGSGFEAVRNEEIEGPGSEPTSVLGVFDVDGDRRLDLLFGTYGTLMVACGEEGHFAPLRAWGDYTFGALTVAELTGDRSPDLLELMPGALLLRRGQGREGPVGRPRALLANVAAVTTADLDADGVVELLATSWWSDDAPQSLSIGRATAEGNYVFTHQELPPRIGEALIGEIVVHDWDEDGVPDVAITDSQGLTIVRQRP